MRKILILIFIFFNSYSQNKDSLLAVINNYKFQDTLQCYRLSLLINAESDYDIWVKYNQRLGQICLKQLNAKSPNAVKKSYLSYYGTYFNNLGRYLSNNDQYDKALINYRKAILYYTKSGNIQYTADCYLNSAIALINKGDSKNYFQYYDKALNVYIKYQDSVGIANVYADLGYQYSENGADDKALKYLFKSLNIADKIKNKEIKFRTLEYLVKTLKSQNENEKALFYALQIAQYHQDKENKENLALIYFSIASTYNALGNASKLFEFTSRSIAIAKKNNYENIIAASYGLLAKHYLSKRQTDNAFKYSKLELQIREISQKEPNLTKSLSRFIEILILKKEFNLAKPKAELCFEKAQALENPELILQAAKNLKTIYLGLNNKSKAFDFAEIELKMIDSLSKITTQNSAIKNLFKYETAKKENEVKQLAQAKKITELENKRQKTTLSLLIFGIISALITSYLLFKKYKTNKQNQLLKSEIEKSIAEKKATESELKALKSQMNPHFIFNALNSIQEQFMFGDKVMANEQMGNFTSLTRQILMVSGKKKISLATEIDVLTKYLELEKMRFDRDFEYSIQMSDNIDDEYTQLPPMLLQPFVENSIKHGLLHQEGAKKVSIAFELNEDQNLLICTIEDNGIGRKKSEEIKSKNKHNSFSTESIAQRLQLLNEENASDTLIYEDLMDSNGNGCGTRVILKIYL